MPIKGFTHVSLSVTDLERSLAFYRDLLGLGVFVDRFDGSAFEGEEVMLLAGRTVLCLQAHAANDGERFDPTHSGLDHLAFTVESMDELEQLGRALDAAGIRHSGIRPITHFGHLIEVRDPDGIQVELHVPPRP